MILESLHAMEADLVPATTAGTHAPLLSVSAHNGIPTFDGKFDWKSDYNVDVDKWNLMSLHQRNIAFIEAYDKIKQQWDSKLDNRDKTKNLIDVVEDAKTKIAVAAATLELHRTIKDDFQNIGTQANILLNIIKEPKAATNQITASTLEELTAQYDGIMKLYPELKQKYRQSIDKSIMHMQTQNEAVLHENNLLQKILTFEETLKNVYINICAHATEKVQNSNVEKYTEEQRNKANENKKGAIDRFDDFNKRVQSALKQLGAGEAKMKSLRGELGRYDTDVTRIGGLVESLGVKMPSFILAQSEAQAAAKEELEKKEISHTMDKIMQQLEDMERHVQEEKTQHARAAAEREQQEAVIRNQQRDLVAEQVSLSAGQLHNVVKENAVIIENQAQIVALRETQVSLTEAALGDARKKAEIEAKKAQGGQAGAAQALWSLSQFVTNFVTRHTEPESAEAAQAVLALAAAKNTEHAALKQAYETALSCAQKCLAANNTACASAKQEIEVYTDMIPGNLKKIKQKEQLTRLQQECKAYIIRIKKDQNDEQNKQPEDTDRVEYLTNFLEKINGRLEVIQKNLQIYTTEIRHNESRETAQETAYQAAFETYVKARHHFEEADKELHKTWKALPDRETAPAWVALIADTCEDIKSSVKQIIERKTREMYPELDEAGLDEDMFTQLVDIVVKVKSKRDLFQETEPQIAALTIVTQRRPKAVALHEKISEKIDELCILTIEIENAEAQHKASKQALHDILFNDITIMSKELDDEIEATNKALNFLVQVQENDVEKAVYNDSKLLSLDMPATIPVRLAALRHEQSVAAAADANEARLAQEKEDARLAQEKEDARLAQGKKENEKKEKNDEEHTRLERLQLDYDNTNKTTRHSIDIYLNSYDQVRAQCEARVRMHLQITHNETKLLHLQQLLLLELPENVIAKINDKIIHHQSKITQKGLEMKQLEERLSVLTSDSNACKILAEKEAAICRSDRFQKEKILRINPQWNTQEIIPLFNYDVEYARLQKSFDKEDRKKRDAKIQDRRNALSELVRGYKLALTEMKTKMLVTIKIQLKRDKLMANKDMPTQLVVSEVELRTARDSEAQAVDKVEKFIVECIPLTYKVLCTLLDVPKATEKFCDNLVHWEKKTPEVIRNDLLQQERLDARQPEPAEPPQPAPQAPANISKNAIYEKNKQSAVAILAAIKSNGIEIKHILNLVKNAYDIKKQGREKNAAVFDKAVEEFKRYYVQLARIIETHNEEVELYRQKVKIVVQNAPNEENSAYWRRQINDAVSLIDLSTSIQGAGIKEDDIARMSSGTTQEDKPKYIDKNSSYEECAEVANWNYKALQHETASVAKNYKLVMTRHEVLMQKERISDIEREEFVAMVAEFRGELNHLHVLKDINRDSAVLARGKTDDITSKKFWTDIANYPIEDFKRNLILHDVDNLKPVKVSAVKDGVPQNGRARKDAPRKDALYDDVRIDDTSYTKPSSLSLCSFNQSLLAFAAQLLALVYPPVPAKTWLARPPVARYAHPDRARAAGGSLELHALCARVAHIALLVHIDPKTELIAAHRFLVELPEHARLLALACSPAPSSALYAARAAPSREHANAPAIRACLSRSSLQPLRACAAATVAAAMPTNGGTSNSLMNQSSQQYV